MAPRKHPPGSRPEAPKSRRSPAKGRWLPRDWPWRLLRGLATLGVWGVIGAGLLVAWYATDLPDVDAAASATRRPAVTVQAADGSTLGAVGDVYGEPLMLKELPPALPRAVIATEDRRFYSHFGLDPIGLARAAVVNLRARRVVQGGSTISQQVAKNLFLTSERSLKRKVQELLLALWIERRFNKDQILTMYLNRVYLGTGTYGVDAAARRYFNKSARELSVYESALLAGLLKAPSRYNPVANPNRAAARTDQVLANMEAAGFLDEKGVAAAKAGRSAAIRRVAVGTGRHFVDWVLEQVPSFVNPGDRDLVVRTTLDAGLQRLAEAEVAKMLDGPGNKAGVSEAAMVVLDPSGAVRAMVGGRDYEESQFNRAVLAKRQPGSSFKPMVYLAGLEAGLGPGTRMVDERITIKGWSPENFDGKFRGEVRLDEAVAHSINTVAVKVAEKVGRQRVIDVARRLGIISEIMPTPSLALGAAEMSVLEMATAYAHFANGGIGVWAYAIEGIGDVDGRPLYRRQGSGPGPVVAPRHVSGLNAMLQGVITEGTGMAAALDRPVAGKTGTSQSFRDAWFVGYTADLVGAVWLGNDDGTPMRKVTGGGLPAKLWHDVMAPAHHGRPVRPLPGGDGGPPEDDPEERLAAPAPDSQPSEGFWDALINRLAGGR